MDTKRAAALRVLQILEEHNFAAYWVGGCVRDLLRRENPTDYDIATSALPEAVLACFPQSIPTGLQHGTVTVRCDGESMEVTTFRTEAEYTDRRRPSQVAFVTSLATDLSRRDFTVNAMAMDLRGNVYDYFSGQEDLKARRLRTVGSAADRFREDALRMVRAARFVAQLGMTLDREAEQAMLALRNLCRSLAIERTVAEMDKLLRSPYPVAGAKILFRCGLTAALLPFAHWHETHAKLLTTLDQVHDGDVRWCLWLACFHTTPAQLEGRLRSLKISNAFRLRLQAYYRIATACQPWNRERVQYWLLTEGLRTVYRAALLAQQLGLLTAAEAEPIATWWAALAIHNPRQLEVSGGELLQALGAPAGPWIRTVLQQLFLQVALGELPNEKAKLLQRGAHLYHAQL